MRSTQMLNRYLEFERQFHELYARELMRFLESLGASESEMIIVERQLIMSLLTRFFVSNVKDFMSGMPTVDQQQILEMEADEFHSLLNLLKSRLEERVIYEY